MQHKDACPILPSRRIESIDVVFPYGGLAHETFCLDGLEPTRGNGKRVDESRKLKVFLQKLYFVCVEGRQKNIYCVYPLVQIQVSFFSPGGGGCWAGLRLKRTSFAAALLGFCLQTLMMPCDDEPWISVFTCIYLQVPSKLPKS